MIMIMNKNENISDLVFNLKLKNEKNMTLDLVTINSLNGSKLCSIVKDHNNDNYGFFKPAQSTTIIEQFFDLISNIDDFISSNLEISKCAILLIYLNNKNNNLIREYVPTMVYIDRFFNTTISNLNDTVEYLITDNSQEYNTAVLIGYLIPEYKYIICMKPTLCGNKNPEIILYDYDDEYNIKIHENKNNDEIESYISMLSLVTE